MTIDLDEMNLEELKSLQKSVTKAIHTYEQKQKEQARKELEEHAQN